MRLHRDLDLGAHRVGDQIHQRQVAVRGATGDDLQMPCFHKTPESLIEVVVIAVDEQVARLTQLVKIHPGQRLNLRFGVGALDFLFGKLQRTVQKPDVTPLKQVVA